MIILAFLFSAACIGFGGVLVILGFVTFLEALK